MGEINSSKDIIDELFKYIDKTFDDFGHQESNSKDWWWNTARFGGSWSPFVETCFILYGERITEQNSKLLFSWNDAIENNCDIINESLMNNFKNNRKINRNIEKSDDGNIYDRSYDNSFLRIKFDENKMELELRISDYFIHREENGKLRIYNPKYRIYHDYTHRNIETFMGTVHERVYNKNNKYPQNKSDINLVDNGNYILSLEHSEDGSTPETQLQKICAEIEKLKRFPSRFKVLVSRPQWFDKSKEDEGYSKSVDCFKDKIQNNLRNGATLDNSEKWLIILIAPYPDHNPTKIIFYCYEWNGNELSDLDKEHKYCIKIKEENGKWVKVPSE